jgi:hypothetical protein
LETPTGSGYQMDLEGFEPSTSSVRLKREGLSASSAAYGRWIYPLEIRKNGGKTAKNVIFHHARQLWLQMVANGCKWHEEGNAARCPVLRYKSIPDLVDGIL